MSNEIKNKHKILIADDSEMNRFILTDMLGEEFEILEAEDGNQAVAVLRQMGNEISLVLLDIVMPGKDGFEVLAVMNQYHWIDDIPVIMISAENAPSYVERAYELGVTDYISRPFDALVVHRRVTNTIMLYAKQKKLIGMVADQIYEKQKSSSLMINILSHIVEFRNGESGLHVLHINTMTELLLNRLVQKTDRYHLSQSDISLISTASALHDIGKIAIPEAILNKPGKLTAEEFEIIKTHSMIGASMLKELPFHQNEPLVKIAYEICRWHHERYDGKGYPDGLQGEEIPISAQIVSLADVYDALTSVRVYKEAFSHEKAMQMILNGECGTFNPFLMECLADVADHIQEELKVNSVSRENRRDMKNTAMEMLQHEELSNSERTLRMLEQERAKYQFFTSISKEIQFEYTSAPPMLILSKWGAYKLGLDEVIMDPLHDRKIYSVISQKALLELRDALRNTTPDQPVIQYDCEFRIGRVFYQQRLMCRATWTLSEPPRYIGAIGKVIDSREGVAGVDDLKQIVSHDAMTGLYNQKYAEEQIRCKIQREPNKTFAMVILDLDSFKSANDQYGHIFGDQVLKYTAERISQSIRNEDIAARVGGDEFLIFLEYQKEARPVIDRIFRALVGEYDSFPVSVSMGVATTQQVGTEYEMLFRCADQALRAGKLQGRRRYCFYHDTMKDMLSALSPIEDQEGIR